MSIYNYYSVYLFGIPGGCPSSMCDIYKGYLVNTPKEVSVSDQMWTVTHFNNAYVMSMF